MGRTHAVKRCLQTHACPSNRKPPMPCSLATNCPSSWTHTRMSQTVARCSESTVDSLCVHLLFSFWFWVKSFVMLIFVCASLVLRTGCPRTQKHTVQTKITSHGDTPWLISILGRQRRQRQQDCCKFEASLTKLHCDILSYLVNINCQFDTA